jgi:hypothetical protein
MGTIGTKNGKRGGGACWTTTTFVVSVRTVSRTISRGGGATSCRGATLEEGALVRLKFDPPARPPLLAASAAPGPAIHTSIHQHKSSGKTVMQAYWVVIVANLRWSNIMEIDKTCVNRPSAH